MGTNKQTKKKAENRQTVAVVNVNNAWFYKLYIILYSIDINENKNGNKQIKLFCHELYLWCYDLLSLDYNQPSDFTKKNM